MTSCTFLVIEQGKQKEARRWLLEFWDKRQGKKATPSRPCRISFTRLYRQQRIHSKNQDDLHAIAQQCLKTNHLLAAHIVYELLDKTERHHAKSFLSKAPLRL